MNRTAHRRAAALLGLAAIAAMPLAACADNGPSDPGPTSTSPSPTTTLTSPPGAFKTSPSASAGLLPSSSRLAPPGGG